LHSSTLSRIVWCKLLAGGFVIALGFAALGQNQPEDKTSLRVRLGFRLFKDDRFSSPQGDLQNSCLSCHLSEEDPQGTRAHADFFARSWVPWRAGDPRRDELRNSPTILDAALMPRLHFDGEFDSLEGLVRGTLAGRPMGWLPGEEEQSFERVRGVILKDSGDDADLDSSYHALFKAAYDVDTERLNKSQLIDLTVKAISDFLRTLKSTRSTPYDRFVKANGLYVGPDANGSEDPKRFANRLLDKIAALEKTRALKLANDFDATALKGLKVFFRTEGAGARGNCVTCHTPPLFTDLSFHNMGISQSEYDHVHGERTFEKLEIPDVARSERPSRQYREIPSLKKPGCADLGYWNFVDVKNSSLRRAGESDDRFLQRMTATFKTPTLRDLAFTYPYMHTGGFTTVESALSELMRLSEMARAGHVREGDDELAKIMISEGDVGPLVAFLMTLNDDLKPGQKY
jgi:cytochrome c peroxidase